MPTYQYACTNADCGNRFELVQKFTDPAADTCPVCGSAVRKVFSAVGVVFKGSGFYRNDSREGANKVGAAARAESKSDSGDGPSKDSAKAKETSGSAESGAGSKPAKDGASSGSTSSGSSSGSSSSGSSSSSAGSSGAKSNAKS
jgi:putative FmdB family regulatory protein